MVETDKEKSMNFEEWINLSSKIGIPSESQHNSLTTEGKDEYCIY